MAKRFLIIIGEGVDGSLTLKEALDQAMVIAAFGQSIALLFEGRGVLHLLAEQRPEGTGMKPYAKMLQALALYDINDLYYCEESACRYGLQQSDPLVCPAVSLDRKAHKSLLHEVDCLFDYP